MNEYWMSVKQCEAVASSHVQSAHSTLTAEPHMRPGEGDTTLVTEPRHGRVEVVAGAAGHAGGGHRGSGAGAGGILIVM